MDGSLNSSALAATLFSVLVQSMAAAEEILTEGTMKRVLVEAIQLEREAAGKYPTKPAPSHPQFVVGEGNKKHRKIMCLRLAFRNVSFDIGSALVDMGQQQ